jgi:hypothetical protein
VFTLGVVHKEVDEFRERLSRQYSIHAQKLRDACQQRLAIVGEFVDLQHTWSVLKVHCRALDGMDKRFSIMHDACAATQCGDAADKWGSVRGA